MGGVDERGLWVSYLIPFDTLRASQVMQGGRGSAIPERRRARFPFGVNLACRKDLSLAVSMESVSAEEAEEGETAVVAAS